ncbi:heterokaryon incompatibility protein-domain-containing protein [Triangularia setosa]|uniref:Heterokaryon incompatibility protein-domain-containing protein n=1 Tax=Triangularia setosa TaxID=2587417 RepID=A0AAN6WC03_9PEZI|nr:heterokaryon incompatibility protein-domain-containing protein [Podospora setosa]
MDNASLCTTCHGLAEYHRTIPVSELLASTKGGCQSCILLSDIISQFDSCSNLSGIRLIVDCTLHIAVYSKEKGRFRFGIEVFLQPRVCSPWKNIGQAKTVPTTLSITESVALIGKWLHGCQTSHTSCKGRRTTVLPSRIIKVGQSSANVSLYITQDGEKGSYIALSHCWGGKIPLATTKDNLHSLCESLQFDANSKTFAEAVDVTRALGVQYLWIDSICIVQDDADDWATEAAKMRDVYSNAMLTLSADGAQDTSQGLFGTGRFDARALANKTCTVTTQEANGSSVKVYARLRSAMPFDPNTAPHSSLSTKESKLSTRAWVLQERMLSPRTVHFYDEELVWSCFGQQRCECREMAVASESGHFRRLLLASEGATRESGRNLLIEWPKVVEEFTTKGLTYPKDRLPALSGLATLLQEKTTSRYLAGLWSDDMAYSLLWTAHHAAALDINQPIIRMPVVPFAPSWSWASVVGPIKYIDRHRDQFTHRRSGDDEVKPIIEVLQATTTPATPNVYGPVSAGFVTVRGQVLSVRYNSLESAWWPVSDENHPSPEFEPTNVGFTPKFIPDVLEEDPRFSLTARLSTLFTRFVLLRAATYLWEGSVSSESTEVVAILLGEVPVASLGEGVQLPFGVDVVYQRRGIILHAFHSQKVWKDVPVRTVTIA